MKIYTKTGDAGETGLLGGGRATKDCITLRVVGELDELNAALGITSSKLKVIKLKELSEMVLVIQRDLFKFGSEIASVQTVIPAKAGIHSRQSKRLDPRLHGDDIVKLEKSIDSMWRKLPELKNFIIPGGCEAAAQLHLARAICRRAERELGAFGKIVKLRPELYQHLNRLSDWLFTAARWVNMINKIDEIII